MKQSHEDVITCLHCLEYEPDVIFDRDAMHIGSHNICQTWVRNYVLYHGHESLKVVCQLHCEVEQREGEWEFPQEMLDEIVHSGGESKVLDR